MTVTDILKAAQQPAWDRTARYSARLDAHLATLANDTERARFCAREEAKWIERYAAWAADVDAGNIQIKADGASAWDYSLTLAAIGTRKSDYERKAGGANA